MAPVAELPMASPAPAAWIELRLAKGRTLRFESSIDDAALTRLIRAVDAA
jgi:transposase